MQIQKSNLMARLIYGGQKLRTRECPIHEGRWSGCELSPSQACPKGCGLTGWIPEPEDGGPAHGSDPETWKCTSKWATYHSDGRVDLTDSYGNVENFATREEFKKRKR